MREYMKKLIGVFLAVGLAVTGVAGVATSASSTEAKCYTTVHVEATYKEVLVKEAYDDPDTISDKVFYHWTGGPRDTAPAIGEAGWKSDNGNHNGHDDPGPNVVYNTSNNDNGRASWFYYTGGEVIPGEHHEAEYETVVDVPAHDEDVEVPCPEDITPPDPLIEVDRDVSYFCGDDYQTVHVIRTTTTYDPESGPIVWDILDVVVDEFDLIEPHEVEACSSLDEPVSDNPKSKVPTVAPDAGLPNTGA